jgi:DNA-3-methyladenine glycosylase I
MSDYCEIAKKHPFHGPYHDDEYGFPLTDQNLLFERLSLEIFQAGLSWLLILKRREGLREAFDHFQIDKVKTYNQGDIERLMTDQRVIRNSLKIKAIIRNAEIIDKISQNFGSFSNWLNHHHPQSHEDWVRLFRKNFKFTGPEIVSEFLMSIGLLPGAHREDCPIYQKILQLK